MHLWERGRLKSDDDSSVRPRCSFCDTHLQGSLFFSTFVARRRLGGVFATAGAGYLFAVMKKHYETVFIVNSSLPEEGIGKCIQAVKRFLTGKDATIVAEKGWGLRKLAYPIKKRTHGYYHWIEFQAVPAVIADLEVVYKRDEQIIRHLVVALDKHAIALNRKQKKETLKSEDV